MILSPPSPPNQQLVINAEISRTDRYQFHRWSKEFVRVKTSLRPKSVFLHGWSKSTLPPQPPPLHGVFFPITLHLSVNTMLPHVFVTRFTGERSDCIEKCITARRTQDTRTLSVRSGTLPVAQAIVCNLRRLFRPIHPRAPSSSIHAPCLA